MAEWIAGFAPDTVVMENTGIYWKSPYVALEKIGIRALVVNAQNVADTTRPPIVLRGPDFLTATVLTLEFSSRA